MKLAVYVMPEPHVRVVDGEFRFTGEAKKVTDRESSFTEEAKNLSAIKSAGRRSGVLDYLFAAGAYDSKKDVYSGSVSVENGFSIKERLERVDEALPLVDEKRLKKDLDKKGYAFLMSNGDAGAFEDYQNKGFITRLDRVVQGLIFQRLPKELKLDSDVRHLKAQESVELMVSDKEYQKTMRDYSTPNSEIIQLLRKQPAPYIIKDDKLDIVRDETEFLTPVEVAFVNSRWDRVEACPSVLAGGISSGSDFEVAVLKKKS